MSLILEALKKSERQRRLGEMPNLGTPMLAPRRRRSLLPWLAGAIVVALAAGAWLHFAPPVQTVAQAPADPAVTAPAAPATTPAPATKPPPAPPVPPEAIARKPAATAKPGVRLPDANDKPGSVADLPTSSLVGGPRKPPAPATPPPATPPAKPAAPTASPASKPTATATAAAPPKAPPARDAKATAPAEVAVAKPARPAPRAPAAPAVPALPSVWDMPYSVRKDLPALALTMHVYSSVPADRFVVVEGERHVEGDELGDGVTLREIRSDGIVLDFKGQRFVYPRDGR